MRSNRQGCVLYIPWTMYLLTVADKAVYCIYHGQCIYWQWQTRLCAVFTVDNVFIDSCRQGCVLYIPWTTYLLTVTDKAVCCIYHGQMYLLTVADKAVYCIHHGQCIYWQWQTRLCTVYTMDNVCIDSDRQGCVLYTPWTMHLLTVTDKAVCCMYHGQCIYWQWQTRLCTVYTMDNAFIDSDRQGCVLYTPWTMYLLTVTDKAVYCIHHGQCIYWQWQTRLCAVYTMDKCIYWQWQTRLCTVYTMDNVFIDSGRQGCVLYTPWTMHLLTVTDKAVCCIHHGQCIYWQWQTRLCTVYTMDNAFIDSDRQGCVLYTPWTMYLLTVADKAVRLYVPWTHIFIDGGRQGCVLYIPWTMYLLHSDRQGCVLYIPWTMYLLHSDRQSCVLYIPWTNVFIDSSRQGCIYPGQCIYWQWQTRLCAVYTMDNVFIDSGRQGCVLYTPWTMHLLTVTDKAVCCIHHGQCMYWQWQTRLCTVYTMDNAFIDSDRQGCVLYTPWTMHLLTVTDKAVYCIHHGQCIYWQWQTRLCTVYTMDNVFIDSGRQGCVLYVPWTHIFIDGGRQSCVLYIPWTMYLLHSDRQGCVLYIPWTMYLLHSDRQSCVLYIPWTNVFIDSSRQGCIYPGQCIYWQWQTRLCAVYTMDNVFIDSGRQGCVLYTPWTMHLLTVTDKAVYCIHHGQCMYWQWQTRLCTVYTMDNAFIDSDRQGCVLYTPWTMHLLTVTDKAVYCIHHGQCIYWQWQTRLCTVYTMDNVFIDSDRQGCVLYTPWTMYLLTVADKAVYCIHHGQCIYWQWQTRLCTVYTMDNAFIDSDRQGCVLYTPWTMYLLTVADKAVYCIHHGQCIYWQWQTRPMAVPTVRLMSSH